MRATFIILFTLSWLQGWPQGGYLKHLERNAATFGLMALGGSLNGVSDVLRDKYSVSIFPQSGPGREFWDPEISWTRKYKDWPADTRPAYPGSKTWLGWTTDGWHLAKTGQLTSMQISVVVYRQPERTWWKIMDVVLMKICFSSGWHLSNKILTR